MPRYEGIVLVARKDSEYWFIDSVFDHGNLAGCVGIIVCPITEEAMEDLLSIESLEERFGDCWEERYNSDVKDDCEACDGMLDDDGCEKCGYPSLRSYCIEIGNDGFDAIIDDQDQCVEALDAVCDDKIEYADCTGCGRIFGRMALDDFDEVYNRKALVACLAYEDGAVEYDYAVRVIFGAIK